MTNKDYIRLFLLTSVIGTLLFFVFGYLVFAELLNYNDWILVFFPIHVIISFLLFLPLLLPFKLIDKFMQGKNLILATVLKAGLGMIYISALLWFSIFNDQSQRENDPFNYYEDLKYLGLNSSIILLTFLVLMLFSQKRLTKKDENISKISTANNGNRCTNP